jgi:phosphatidylglycerol---prolipoprotein diacylglyceryl transferase
LSIPFEPSISGYPINVHLILEYLAFFLAFRYYLYCRKNSLDTISKSNRLSIILGAVVGAFLGSRLVGILENPLVNFKEVSLIQLLNVKTIMGGLFGGLLGVELAKKIIGEKESSGDLFTFPIIVGIFIGRMGCFLTGTNEFTYGTETKFFAGMNLGDGLMRHPIALYELLFLILLFLLLKKTDGHLNLKNGDLFKIFMILYFGFRFMIEFIKPNEFYFLFLSTIQWLCVICFFYYRRFIVNLIRYAR